MHIRTLNTILGVVAVVAVLAIAPVTQADRIDSPTCANGASTEVMLNPQPEPPGVVDSSEDAYDLEELFVRVPGDGISNPP